MGQLLFFLRNEVVRANKFLTFFVFTCIVLSEGII
jgi:hypothetical protein